MLNDIERQFTETALNVSNLALLIVNAVHEGKEYSSHIINLSHEANSLAFMADTHNLGSARPVIPEIVVGLYFQWSSDSAMDATIKYISPQSIAYYESDSGFYRGFTAVKDLARLFKEGALVVVE